jgi:hypothetical protein
MKRPQQKKWLNSTQRLAAEKAAILAQASQAKEHS